MSEFWTLFKESVILQGCVTELSQLLQLVVGFWLGSKTQHLIEKGK